jgi:hypothetical protein
VSAAALQLAAWCAAFWLALALHARSGADARARARFALGLFAGALLARAGHSLVWGEVGRMLEPAAAFSVFFLPLGVLALAPHSAALASLPLPLALARLGCLAAGCCRGAAGEPLPVFESAGWVALHLGLARTGPDRVTERFAVGFGFLRLAQAPWRPPAAATALATPELVALLWVTAGALLCARRRQRERVTKSQRFPHAFPSPGGVPCSTGFS